MARILLYRGLGPAVVVGVFGADASFWCGGAHCRGGSISIFQGFFANVCGVLFGDWGKRLAIILSGLEIF